MRSRERIVHAGVDHVGDIELIAVILGTGTRDRPVATIASDVVARARGIGGIGRLHATELAGVNGIGEARAARLLAAIELGRRAMVDAIDVRQPVLHPEHAAEMLGPALRNLAHEELHALYLDRRRRAIARRRLTSGSDAFTVVDPRQIFREAIGLGASSVILAHNHPSGDPTPSVQDREITRRVAHAGRILGVPLVDHLVIAGAGYVSLAAEGELPGWAGHPSP